MSTCSCKAKDTFCIPSARALAFAMIAFASPEHKQDNNKHENIGERELVLSYFCLIITWSSTRLQLVRDKIHIHLCKNCFWRKRKIPIRVLRLQAYKTKVSFSTLWILRSCIVFCHKRTAVYQLRYLSVPSFWPLMLKSDFVSFLQQHWWQPPFRLKRRKMHKLIKTKGQRGYTCMFRCHYYFKIGGISEK